MKKNNKEQLPSLNLFRTYPKFSANSQRSSILERWGNCGYVGDISTNMPASLKDCCGFAYSYKDREQATLVQFTENDLVPLEHRVVVVWFNQEEKACMQKPERPTLEELKLLVMQNPSCNALYEYAVWFLQKYSHVDHKPRRIRLRGFLGHSVGMDSVTYKIGNAKYGFVASSPAGQSPSDVIESGKGGWGTKKEYPEWIVKSAGV